jgi:predicted  nucleic acid-binding Zn-ribbon protein
MADKRTTPEAPAGAPQAAPQGPRRKKRAAPTIDLAATEMPPPEAASPPRPDPPPAPAQEPPAEAWPHGPISMATIAAGIAGAVTVTLILFALWLAGLLPVRYVASTDTGAQVSVDTKAIEPLTQRVSKIEGTISKLPASDAGVTERLAAADSAMKSLGIALTALNRRSDDTAATAAQARERADAAAKAVTDLRASLQDAAKNSSAGISPAELDALQKRIAALEQSAKAARDDIAKASSADTAARLALSAAGLRDAVASGAPFAAELA